MEAEAFDVAESYYMKLKRLLGVCALPVSSIGPIGIVFTLPGLRLSAIRFDLRLLVASLGLSLLFLLSYTLVQNEAVVRAVYLVIANYVLYSIVQSRPWRNHAIYVADLIYKVNISILLLSYLFDSVAVLFSRAGVGPERLGGLIGYDFVAFFVSIYIISRIETGRLLFRWPLFFHLSLATFATLNSGRFGFFILLILYSYVFMRFASVKTLIIILVVGVVGYTINSDRINLIFNTVLGIYEYVTTNSSEAFSSISVEDATGFYAASPLTWIGEFGLAFSTLPEHLLPSSSYTAVDSGLAYMILNSGFLLSFLFYGLLFSFLRSAHARNVFIVLIFVATDLKFRSAFSVFPMLWIYLNCVDMSEKSLFQGKKSRINRRYSQEGTEGASS